MARDELNVADIPDKVGGNHPAAETTFLHPVDRRNCACSLSSSECLIQDGKTASVRLGPDK
jgi:hypothetical protein